MAEKKWLIITEKPSVAADLSRALKKRYGTFEKNDDYYTNEFFDLTWAVGHLLEIAQPEEINPKYKAWLLQDLPILPQPFLFVPKPKQKGRLKIIEKLLKQRNVQGVINACDAGREGELIFRTILDHSKSPKPFQRLWLQSLTPEAILEAFESLRQGRELDPLGDAAYCRIESDWLIGINLTRALTRRLKTRSKSNLASWSVGRVQTPTLSLVVEREKTILAYEPVQYWTFKGVFQLQGETYEGQWFDPKFPGKEKKQKELEKAGLKIESSEITKTKLFLKKRFEEICEKFKSFPLPTKVIDETKNSSEASPLLYDLTTLQKEANQLFGFSSKRTLQAAQSLYEKSKMITYPRSDSRYLPSDYLPVCEKTSQNLINSYPELKPVKTLLNHKKIGKRVFDDSKVSDHFALIPTGHVSSLSGDGEKIFYLILKRFFEAFLPAAQWIKGERITECQKEFFLTKQSELKKPGWRQVEQLLKPSGKSSILTLFDQPQEGTQTDLKSEEAWSKPPGRYTESRLLSLMENCGRLVEDEQEEVKEALKEKGLGTPATRADIIENLLTKEYLVRINKNLFPTSKAMILIDVLERVPLQQFASPKLTGQMEFELRQVEQGKLERNHFMSKVTRLTEEATQACKTFQYEDLYKEENAFQGSCPHCKEQLKETLYAYKCDQCDFLVWKQKGHGFISPQLFQRVLKKGKVGPLDWMMRGGTLKKVYLHLEEKTIVLRDEEGASLEAKRTEDETKLSEQKISETFLGSGANLTTTDQAYYAHYDPPVKGAQNSRLPKTLCSREMTFPDFLKLIVTGETEIISNFISKKNRPFSAQLYLKKNGSFGFRFAKKKKEQAN